jgi:hypothetical protein
MAAEELVRIHVRALATERSRVQFVELEGVRVGLHARYSAYDGVWRLWLLATDGTQIAGPISLVPGLDLLLGHKHDPRVPPGQLFVYSPDRAAPTLDTIDVSAVLYYRRSTTT